MIFNLRFIFLIFIVLSGYAYARNQVDTAVTQVIPVDQLQGYKEYPLVVQQLINSATQLTEKNLTYTYASADPAAGGMDCSGTIYYLLTAAGIPNVPRQANQIYQWVWEHGKFYSVTSNNFKSFEFSKLKPGDLLFWSGTYAVERDPPITHVMMYLGKDLQNHHLMFGASDGRPYQGKKMNGVSVFDFTLPDGASSARFIGYSCIPTLTCN